VYVQIEQVKEPVAAVASVLERVSSRLLMSVYKIAAYSDCEGMLRQVAVARGRLKKGGTADVEAAARVVLSDWRDGTIPFHTLPPSRGNEQFEAVSIVTEASEGIDMGALLESEQQVFAKLQDSEMEV
jgi:nuclear GTP-binding protein